MRANKQVKIFYGPTASGKSAKALELAQTQDITIINADAMQCYDALPKLTAQPSLEERMRAPHRLYSVIDATENMVVTDWCALALQEIKDAHMRDSLPVLVGGTGFYLKALMEGLSEIPDIPVEIRQKAQALFDTEGLERLLEDIRADAPETLKSMDTQNPRRIIRAWEVLHHTGKSLQFWQTERKYTPLQNDLDFDIDFVLRPRDELVERINKRFDQMMQDNLLEEVRLLSERVDKGDVPENSLCLKAHGFRPLRAYLKEEMTLEDAVERSKVETRQYAKRQMTWARSQFSLQK